MSCNTCNPCNPCGSCKPQRDCDILNLSWVPGTDCTLSLRHGNDTTIFDLCPGIKGCETLTDFYFSNGCNYYIDEHNEEHKVCVSEYLPYIYVTELGDVDFDDTLKGNCYEFIYHKDTSCGDGCKSKDDGWINWNIYSPGALDTGLAYLRGAGEDGCPAYLEKPENCSLLVFSPNCAAPTGEWQAYTIPDSGDCVIEPDENGYYNVLVKDDCGCIKECRMPVIPSGMAALNYQRDSVPDDPDFPWYYGCYNDRINLHLADNAPQYFGKYDLKVTINYGVQAIKSDKFNFNYNWRSLVVPVVEGEEIRTSTSSSILQNWAMSSAAGEADIPWGTSSLRGTITFIVPKGKEAYLHHEYRVRTNASFPNYYTGAWDGQKVPDSEATLNNAQHPASRLNALQVLIEPTQGSTDYDPAKDEYRDRLDSPVDSLPQDY